MPTVGSNGHRGRGLRARPARRPVRRATRPASVEPELGEQRVAHGRRAASSSSVLNVAPLCTIAPREQPARERRRAEVQHQAAAGRLAEHGDPVRDRRRTRRCCRAPTRARRSRRAARSSRRRRRRARRGSRARRAGSCTSRARRPAPRRSACRRTRAATTTPIVNAPPGNHTSTGRRRAPSRGGREHVQREARVLVGRAAERSGHETVERAADRLRRGRPVRGCVARSCPRCDAASVAAKRAAVAYGMPRNTCTGASVESSASRRRAGRPVS